MLFVQLLYLGRLQEMAGLMEGDVAAQMCEIPEFSILKQNSETLL